MLQTNGTKPPTLGEHLAWTKQHHSTFTRHTQDNQAVTLTGDDLSVAELVAVALNGTIVKPVTTKATQESIDASVDFLNEELQAGTAVYGISTGFGGSADTRTLRYADLQRALLQHHHAGVLIPSDIGREDPSTERLASHSLTRTVVRGAMLARCHSLMRGHSAVRREVIGAILNLLNLDFIPVVPLRGSISASGDLTPLSYIGGALEGNPGIYVDCRMESGERKILNSREAMHLAKIDVLQLGPKEALGIMNGTTVSCSSAAIGLHETQLLALLTQALTGMCTEALAGTVENYHPFIAASRPHPGLIEAAANITRFLEGSQLAGTFRVGGQARGLAQDRYALRTAGQWIAPYLEDLMLAAQQLETELNSTTDNPIIDAEHKRIHHGGNFQATSITSVTEKTRLSLQMFGKLLFAQTSELISPHLNGTLPPNLGFDDPSLSFAFKGVEINMAAYMSELAFLANPVSSHVQSAEMGNQSVNSMALVSARYTMEAVEVVSLMGAAHLYALCQAVDLRVLRREYLGEIRLEMEKALREAEVGVEVRVNGNAKAEQNGTSNDDTPPLLDTLLEAIDGSLTATKTKDAPEQAEQASQAVLLALVRPPSTCSLETAHSVSTRSLPIILTAIHTARLKFATTGPTTEVYLSCGSRLLYNFVRRELRVGLHRGLVEHATFEEKSPEGIFVEEGEREVIGEQIGKIYRAIRSGKIHRVLVEGLS